MPGRQIRELFTSVLAFGPRAPARAHTLITLKKSHSLLFFPPIPTS
jgi:hypothetical protein